MRTAAKTLAASAAALTASLALAGGDSGTQSMGEMNLTGAQFGMMIGAVVVLGIVIWLVVKMMNK